MKFETRDEILQMIRKEIDDTIRCKKCGRFWWQEAGEACKKEKDVT